MHYSLLFVLALLAAANAIWDGTNSEIREFPYLVTIEIKNNGREYCQGVIIASNWIVTNNRCASRPADELLVRSGTGEFQEIGSYHQVDKIISHPGFDSTQKVGVNDTVLMHVYEPFKLDGVTRMNSTLFNAGEKVQVGKTAKVAGFGYVRNFSYPTNLQKVDVTILELTKCNKTYEGYQGNLPEGFLCAGSSDDRKGGSNACYYDEGAPLVVDGRLAGIVSRIIYCDQPGYPVMFTEIAHYRNWIDQQLVQFRNLSTAASFPSEIQRRPIVQYQPQQPQNNQAQQLANNQPQQPANNRPQQPAANQPQHAKQATGAASSLNCYFSLTLTLLVYPLRSMLNM